ncbi:hypothetical protein [Limnochorda pilosa]|uniref:Uncharacterized protein n=1 Tax=Limnochorda pilosa TaxID=1555112 RepID=A0A0K2SQ67_LIMPI|nr:hypothetical protein [Limnochorda pilosa]BAS29265.1 hypothetical protein LIP_3453 [Limnochorda pilosa]
MPAHQQIQACIQRCQQVMQQLQQLSASTPDQRVRDLLQEGAHHLQLCVTECQFAAQRIAKTAAQPAMA